MRKRCKVLRSSVVRRPAAVLVAGLAVAVLWAFVRVPAYAQVQIPAEALSDETALQRVFQQGHELEAQRRWGEALAYYEDAVKEFPDRRDLWDRLTQTRLHYDVCRRYQDATYKASLREMTERQAADVYNEVLQKIETHYVKQPGWQELARRGVDNLTIALTESAFTTLNVPHTPADTIRTFSDELRRRMDVTVVSTRQDARQVATVVAQLAASRLSLPPQVTILEFTCGATCALDQYSSFLTGAELEELFSQIEGNFVGLGIELKAHQQALAIVNVIPGGPAEAAGIRAGDRIIEVDGVPTANVSTDEAANLLKGVEGSAVEVTVTAPNGQVRHLRLVRRRVEVPSISDTRIVDPERGIAYLRLASFQKTTARDLDAALWKLHRAGMQSLIVDVRGNPGGLLTAAVEVADRFLETGNIVSTRGRSTREDFDYRAHTPGTWRMPLSVLIDGETASASEIFAGAVRDHRRGTIVGTRSYGKGSVQGIFPLDASRAGVRLTTAKFYSPGGFAISDRGVAPDVLVRNAAKPVDSELFVPPSLTEDPVVKAALQVARNGLAQQQARLP